MGNGPVKKTDKEDIDSLKRQIENLQDNLRLIEERISESVVPSKVPLQLVKDKRELEEKIAGLEAELAQAESADVNSAARQVVSEQEEQRIGAGEAEVGATLIGRLKSYLSIQLLLLFVFMVGVLEGLVGIFDVHPCPRRLILAILATLGGGVLEGVSFLPRYRDRYRAWDRGLTFGLLVITTVALVCLTHQACTSVNRCPAVRLLASPELVKPGGTIKLTVQADDPENDPTVYFWEATVPGLQKQAGPYRSPQNEYVAPPDSWGEEVEITVTVDDRHCGRKIKSNKLVLVLAPPTDTPTPTPTDTPTPTPTDTSTPTPTPICNLHIDDFGDTDPHNDLRKLSGWELDPPGCGTFDVNYAGSELQLDYDLTSSGKCTARYTTTLSLDASPYESLTFEIKGDDKEELSSTVIGLTDKAEREMGVKAGDLLDRVITDAWQAGNQPLAAFATMVDTTQLDILFVEFADTQGTIYLDSLRFERSYVPLTVDNFDDLADPNALGGGTGIYTDGNPGTTLETAYIADGTYDNSPGSYVISYTLPSGEWALWETCLPGLDVSDYAFLSFYVKGVNGGEEVNLYLADGDDRAAYVDVEAYTPITTDWVHVRVPLPAFEGVALTDLTRIKFVFEWQPMTGTIFLDDLRFVADTLLIDNFCDSDGNNSLNGEVGLFTSSPSCTATVTSTLSDGALRLDYDVTAGSGCYSGYWSKTPLDLNPYRTLVVKVRGERCGQVAAMSARTVPVETDKIKLSDYLLDGITDQWQEARIPLAAFSVVTDWTRGNSYAIAFEEHRGALEGTTWWDDVALETACAPLWVDNFNDKDNLNALGGSSSVFKWEAEISSTTTITHAYGDAGAGLLLTYAVPVDRFAGWETDLRNVNLSNYDRLVFNIKSAVGGEKPNIYLVDGDDERGFVNIETYADLSTQWQTVVIPLQNFGDLDLTRIQALQVIIEWEPTGVEGTLFLDNIRFLP